MGLTRTLLKPLAAMAIWHSGKQLRHFLASHARTRQVQESLLLELVEAHKNTEFGKTYRLGSVKSFDDFRSAVPILDYEDYRPYINRVLHGETTALLPAGVQPLMFSLTSGTTGEPKHVPVTQRFLDDTRRGWNMFGVAAIQDHRQAILRNILQISSSTQEASSPSGVPCGAISGLMTANQKSIVKRMYVAPDWAADLTDPQERFYTILRHSIDRDVAFMTTANPSSVLKLLEIGQQHTEHLLRDIAEGELRFPGQHKPPKTFLDRISRRFKPNAMLAKHLEQCVNRDGELLPKHFWNLSFLANWTGGTLRLYIRRLRQLFGDVPVRDIGLVASEGRFSIPLQDNTSSGVAEILSNVLEFIPAEDREKSNPQTLRADELDVGGEYFLVISNWTGLLRYNLDDRIRVTDHYGQSPVFEFLSRGLHTASITGEKITEHQVVMAMQTVRQKTGCKMERFQLQGCFADVPYYELHMEESAQIDAATVATLLDEEVAVMNMEYASKRNSGRLGPIRPILLPQGTFEQLEKQEITKRRGRSEQYKPTYLKTEIRDQTSNT